jgi:hypothetical protein
MTKKSALTQFAIALSLVLSASTTLLAQSTSGSIHGKVLDPSGALVPQAQVSISNADGLVQSVTSDATGNFEVANLPAGSYSVGVDATGFAQALQGEIKVVDGKVTDESINLKISVEQEVTVFATAL